MHHPLKYTDPSGYRERLKGNDIEEISDPEPMQYPKFMFNDWRSDNGGGGFGIGPAGGAVGPGKGLNGPGAGARGWYSAYGEALMSGYIGGISDFINEYERQVYSPNFDGTFHFFTHSNYVDNNGIVNVVATRHEIYVNVNSATNSGGDGLPSINLYKNGEVIEHNGDRYKLFDNKWVKLDNVEINVNALRVVPGMGYVQPIGIKPIMEDAAVVRSTVPSSIKDGLGLEVLITGTVATLIIKGKSAFEPMVYTVLFPYGIYSGSYKRAKKMQEHNIEVDKLRNQ